MSYLFHAANVYEKRMLHNAVSIHMLMMKKNGPQSSNDHGTASETQPIRASDIIDFSNNPSLIANSYYFMKSVRGSPAYFKDALHNLLAMIKNLGPPHLFLTFSCDEFTWPELSFFLDGKEFDSSNICMNNMREKCLADPLSVAVHINSYCQKNIQTIWLTLHVFRGT